MKLAPIAQNPLEWIALKAGLVPTPLAYSHFGFMMSKFLLEAVDKGIFEAIGHSKQSLHAIAEKCKLDERALKSLLGVLASMDLIDLKNELFVLTKKSKKWLLKDSPNSLYSLMMFDNRVCIHWMDHVGTFLQTGNGLQYHDTFSEEEWMYYQKAMEAAATATSKEATRKIPVPKGSTSMLDIGGSHGLYSIALCQKHNGLHSTVLDLPGAVNSSTGEQSRQSFIDYKTGDILTDDIGSEKYDVVLMASVAHHFTNQQNIAVAQKVARALKPGGHYTIIEILRKDKIKRGSDMLGAIGDFFFALSSTSGTWSLEEIKSWQAQAGLTFYKTSTFLSIPGYVAVTAKKM